MDNSYVHSYDAADSKTHTQAQENYAFLNHSTATLPHNLPPSVDDRALGRQKRKRTCAADQEVLEAAYARDPKPDKAARLEIVKLVSLGEKEVQIWFQNRRQSSRRKSRPLLPHEIAQYQQARSEHPPQMYSSDEAAGNEVDSADHHGIKQEEEQSQLGLSEPQMSSRPLSELLASEAASGVDKTGEPAHSLRLPALPVASSPAAPAVSEDRRQTASTIPGPFAATEAGHHVGYLANRRSASSLQLSQTEQEPRPTTRSAVEPEPEPATTDSHRRLKKTPSCVRLSMSFDGNATVVTKDGSSPSPPRASQILLPSANGMPIAPPHLSAIDQASNFAARASLQRSSSGRSRDSRAWEFWCDKDARTELEDKAQKDSSGSAADAIGLLRSASGRSILGAIPAKRNSLLFIGSSDAKRVKLDSKRPLQRSNTSLGRLQGRPGGVTSSTSKPRPKLKYSESTGSVHIPGNESDKENWSPETDIPHSSRFYSSNPASQVPPGRAALGEKRNVGDGHGKRTAGRSMLKASSGGVPDGENTDPEADPEVAAFMGGARKSNSTSSEDDLDCVQGLLSLSQGNWR
ncbi:hypothetical protein LTR36_001644 [Oleoguttula mirabilis]|uniref:Homeobox domain-containing protein n=1 Tax=Oleoguttula mirabilis TaxID=1507867 RepID=A0AAV9JMY9_9PEZI|nr:hypothetical protein LTR36_001644 [Oleoguttula mirabilis]